MPAAVYWRLQLEGTATYHAEVFPLRDAAGAILGGVVIAREVSAGPGGEVGPDLTVRGQPDLDRSPLDTPAPPAAAPGRAGTAEQLQGLAAQGVAIAVNQLTRVLPPLARMLALASTPGRLLRRLAGTITAGPPPARPGGIRPTLGQDRDALTGVPSRLCGRSSTPAGSGCCPGCAPSASPDGPLRGMCHLPWRCPAGCIALAFRCIFGRTPWTWYHLHRKGRHQAG